MKKKNKKKLPRYDIGKFGYLPNKLLNTTTITTEKGIVDPFTEARTAKANVIPTAILKGLTNILYPLQTLLAMSPVITSAGQNLISSGKDALIAGQAVGNQTATLLGNSLIDKGTNMTKLAPTVASNILSGVGTAYGLYNIGGDIAHEGDTASLGLMRNSIGTETYSTENGTYKLRQGLDTGAWNEYEKLNTAGKQLGFTLDSMGLGASVGGFFGPIGMGIGAGAGLLIGGIGSLLGFGDNEKEMLRRQELLADEGSRWNRQEYSEYLDQVNKNQFANKQGAANGKLPGYNIGKGIAKLSGGEVVQLGPIKVEVPGKKNNKDEYIARKGTLLGEMIQNPQSIVYTNKGGISDYIKNGGDESVALEAMKYILKGYKKGKLPGFVDGWADYLNIGLPRIAELAIANRLVNEDRYADEGSFDAYVPNNLGADAVNILGSIKYDPRPYYEQAKLGLKLQNYLTSRMPGITFGGRVAKLNSDFAQYLNTLLSLNAEANRQNAANTLAWANAKALLGMHEQSHKIQTGMQKYLTQQQSRAAKFNAYRTDMSMIPQILTKGANELYQLNKDKDAENWRNLTMGMYKQTLSNELKKVNAEIENMVATRELAAKKFEAEQEKNKIANLNFYNSMFSGTSPFGFNSILYNKYTNPYYRTAHPFLSQLNPAWGINING